MLKLDMTADNLEDLFNIELDDSSKTTKDLPEICTKCNGSGNFIGYTGRVVGPCFACKGKGVKEVRKPVAGNLVDVSKVAASFATAFSKGIKTPKLRLAKAVLISAAGEPEVFETHKFMFSRAPDHGKNAGSIYVKMGTTYLGKITNGEFFPTRDCNETTTAMVIEVASNPDKSSKVYGLRTGVCGCCGRTLTKGVSIDRGIGPICAEKYGFGF